MPSFSPGQEKLGSLYRLSASANNHYFIRVMSEYMAGEVHHSSRIFQKLRPEKHVANH